MRLNLRDYRLHLVICPVDMRRGFQSLNTLAAACLNINVAAGNDCVIFVSSRLNICKAIWSDDKGNSMLTRTLKQGRFRRILARAQEKDCLSIDIEELQRFFDGEDLWTQRKRFTHLADN